MDNTQPLYRRPVYLLLPALGLGIAGDLLLPEGPVGPGLLLWLALLASAALWLTRDAGVARLRTLALWSAAALVAALLTALRDLPALKPLLLFVVLGCAVMTSLHTSGIGLRQARVRDYIVTGFSLPLQLLAGAPQLLQGADPGAALRHPHASGLLRGLVLALPLLLLFGALFAAADAGFSRYAARMTEVLSLTALQHLLLVLVFAWLAAGLLRIACRRPAAADGPATAPAPAYRIGTVEMQVVLALVCALFVVFVLLQLGYLFGGSDVILRTSGLTVAEYARHGFFQLLAVAALTLALLLAASVSDCDRTVLRRYGSILVLCVLVILASALQRLALYTDAFGLTLSRFSALIGILWLGLNLLGFAATVLRGNAAGFASGVAVSLLGCLLLLALLNPASLVTRVNLDRSTEQGSAPDVAYLLSLGADALPLLLQHYDALDARGQCLVAGHVIDHYREALQDDTAAGEDWRRWNLARSKARSTVLQHWPSLAPAATRLERARAALQAALGRRMPHGTVISC